MSGNLKKSDYIQIAFRALAPLTGLLCIFMLAPIPAAAATLIFNDQSDLLTATVTDPTRFTFPSCGGRSEDFPCLVEILPPLGATFLSSTIPILPNIWLVIADPGGLQESDSIQLLLTFSGSLLVEFDSDSDAPLPPFFPKCADLVGFGCQMTEDGTVQTAGTVTWIDNLGNETVDIIQFQSDVEAVPEPSSILLLLTGFAVLGLSIHRGKVGGRKRDRRLFAR